ncbi:hypothetical protein, partial [uncultured Lactobacillus sp.]|uniref:hypothetical protein n=1 Tax=uncultured Lactobacillus sp. TaxID=153152 RepID=UPI0025886128
EINLRNYSSLHKLFYGLHISNEKFKHGEPTGLSEKDLRFYMNETFLVMQRLLDIEESKK